MEMQNVVEVLVLEYRECTDEYRRELLFDAIVKEMDVHLHSKARKYTPGHEYEDRRQRYCLALLRAIKQFKPESNVPFTAFFHLAADNERKMMWRESQHANKSINYDTVSLEGLQEESGKQPADKPDSSTLYTQGYIEIKLAMETMKLTDRELAVAEGYAGGLSRREIARKLGVGDSRIGYLLQQLRRKFERAGITFMVTA